MHLEGLSFFTYTQTELFFIVLRFLCFAMLGK